MFSATFCTRGNYSQEINVLNAAVVVNADFIATMAQILSKKSLIFFALSLLYGGKNLHRTSKHMLTWFAVSAFAFGMNNERIEKEGMCH